MKPRKILNYEVVDFETAQKMIRDDGWQPWGSPTITGHGDYQVQAVVVYEDLEEGYESD